MRRLLTFAVLAAVFSSATFAKPREVRRLKPTSQWVLDYADESCQLGRTFGEGADKVVLILYQLQPGDYFKLTFVGSSVKPDGNVTSGALQFGPIESESEITVTQGTSGPDRILIVDGTERIAPLSDVEQKLSDAADRNDTYYEPAPIGPQREKAASWLALNKIMKFDLVLDTGPMHAAMEALRHCTWDLVGSWGLDVEQQKALSRKTYAKSVARWFDADDYPKKMVRSESEGIVNFRLMVSASGRPESCHIQVSTRPKEFDDVVCKIMMRRARFEPALDAEGRPVRSYYQNTIVFRLMG